MVVFGACYNASTFATDILAVHVQEQAQNALRQSGVDVDALSRSAGDAEKQLSGVASNATPTLNKVVNFLTTSDPATLGKTAAAAVAIYYLSPVALRGLVSAFRGYAGMQVDASMHATSCLLL